MDDNALALGETGRHLPQIRAAGREHLLTHPAATQAAVERGYRRARQYSWRTSAETLLQAYRQVHERRRTTA